MAIANNQMRVIAKNLINESVLVSSPPGSNVATMPVENLQNSNRTLSFRSTAIDASGTVISGELPNRVKVSALVLDGHNLRPGDVFKIKCWAGPAKSGSVFETDWIEALVAKKAGELDWGIDPLTSSVFDNWDSVYSVAWFGLIAVQSYEITIISDGNADGYIEVNQVVLGTAISPGRNFSVGYELGHLDTSTFELTEGESTKRDAGVVKRLIKLQLPRILDTERSAWAEFQRSTTQYHEIFISLFPEQGGALERDYSMICIVKNITPMVNVNAKKFTPGMTLQET